MSSKKLIPILAILLPLLLIMTNPIVTVAEENEANLSLRFVDQLGDPLENAYVEVWNETGNTLLFSGRTDSNGWLNATITKPTTGKYNITVKWDPEGTDAFTVYEAKGLTYGNLTASPSDTLPGYNCTEDGYIVTRVLAVYFTAKDIAGDFLGGFTTTFYYNYSGNVYSVSGKPSKEVLAKIPYDWSWGSNKTWTLRVYWDVEYLKMVPPAYVDGTNVTDYDIWPTETYMNFTLVKDASKLSVGPTAILPSKYGYLNVTVDVHPFYMQLYDWFEDKLKALTSGYSIVKVSIHDANDPSKLLATTITNQSGYVTISQFPNVTSAITVYWLSHEIPVNSTMIVDPTDYNDPANPLKIYCHLVPVTITLKDKRPTPGVLSNAKVIVTWPNLLTHETESNTSGVVQFPPAIDNVYYLPFGDTTLDVYWSITPEDPASWVLVRSAVFTVENSTNSPGLVDVYVDGTKEFDDTDSVVYDLICDVYDAHLALVDLNGDPLVSPTVVLQHPSGATSLVTASPTGTLTLVQVPGGVWHVSVVYKNMWFKPYGMSDVFNITDNIYEAVEFVFPFVNMDLKMVKWATDDYGIYGLNVSISWMGNATITDEDELYEAGWTYTDQQGWVSYEQVPVGVAISVDAWADADYSWFGISENVDVGPYEDEVVLSPENYEGVFHVHIYDLVVKFYDLCPGNRMPDPLPYSNATTIMYVEGEWAYPNTTDHNELVFYSLNQTHMFVGGVDNAYNLVVYWAGVRVFNNTLEIPVLTDPSVSYAEIHINWRVYEVSFDLWDWKHETAMDNLNITVMWKGFNMTFFNETAFEGAYGYYPPVEVYFDVLNYRDLIYDIITGMEVPSEVYQLYTVSLNYTAENLVYIPVWMLKDVIGTPISIVVTTMPGFTADVPSSVEPFVVGCLTRGEVFINGTLENWEDSLIAGELMYEAEDLFDDYLCGSSSLGILNFTGEATAWADIWSYDNETQTFDMKVSAYDMSVSVMNWLDQALKDFTVKVYWNDGGDLTFLTETLTDSNGKATFDIIFWGNCTWYRLMAYREPAEGELPDDLVGKFKLADDVIATADEHVTEDDLEVELPFNEYIGLQVLSATGKVLKEALVYAVRYEPVDNSINGTVAEAGTIAAFGYTSSDGYVYLPFALNDYQYTVRARWYGVSVYDSYDKEMVEYKILSPTVFYTAFTDVFDVSIRLVDDVGRPLKGVYYTFAGKGANTYNISGQTIADGTFTATLVPKGDYSLKAVWTDGVIEILDSDITVDTNIVEHPVKCKVYDATLNLKTPRGTVLKAADIAVTYPDGESYTGTTDADGN
ncbi:MAG: hypothetical protein DRJ30_02075, partial [Candidatus Methanomethylicota archaeon]